MAEAKGGRTVTLDLGGTALLGTLVERLDGVVVYVEYATGRAFGPVTGGLRLTKCSSCGKLTAAKCRVSYPTGKRAKVWKVCPQCAETREEAEELLTAPRS